MRSKEILDFYAQLDLSEQIMPNGVRVMNPYTDPETKDEVWKLMELHAQVAHDENPAEWDGETRAYLATLIKPVKVWNWLYQRRQQVDMARTLQMLPLPLRMAVMCAQQALGR